MNSLVAVDGIIMRHAMPPPTFIVAFRTLLAIIELPSISDYEFVLRQGGGGSYPTPK
jgi:hypothetical protein